MRREHVARALAEAVVLVPGGCANDLAGVRLGGRPIAFAITKAIKVLSLACDREVRFARDSFASGFVNATCHGVLGTAFTVFVGDGDEHLLGEVCQLFFSDGNLVCGGVDRGEGGVVSGQALTQFINLFYE
jgi:hypothetical protein